MDHLLEQDFIRVTEQAAIAAAKTMGFGQRKYSDQVAVEAMRREMDNILMDGRVVIGEGERDKAPMLYVGEELGALRGQDGAMGGDIAGDPLEGTKLCATRSPVPRSPPSKGPTCAPPARRPRSPCSPPPSAAARSTPPTSTWTRSSSARRRA